MFNSLFSSSIEKGDISYLEKLPQILLNKSEIDAINWITEYRAKYNEIPNQERIEKTEHQQFLTDHMVSSPLADLFEQTLKFKQEVYAKREFREIQLAIENDENIDTKRIIDLGFQLSSFNNDKTIFLSDFNRDDIYSETEPKRIKFGLDVIDENTGGLQAGEFAIIAGRPESGKTLLTNFISWNVVSDYDKFLDCKKVLYISGEMTVDRIIARMDSIAGKFNPKILRTKENKVLLKENRKRADESWKRVNFSGGEFVIPKLGIITPNKVLDLINTHKPDLVVCDAMYRFWTNSGKAASDWRELSEIVRSIADMARITNTAILGTSQISRLGEKGNYDLADLAGSDSFGQVTDIVLAVHKLPSNPNSIMIDTLKSRNGTKFGMSEIKISFNDMSYKIAKYENSELED